MQCYCHNNIVFPFFRGESNKFCSHINVIICAHTIHYDYITLSLEFPPVKILHVQICHNGYWVYAWVFKLTRLEIESDYQFYLFFIIIPKRKKVWTVEIYLIVPVFTHKWVKYLWLDSLYSLKQPTDKSNYQVLSMTCKCKNNI